jgi:hypothetical protein
MRHSDEADFEAARIGRHWRRAKVGCSASSARRRETLDEAYYDALRQGWARSKARER